MYYAYVLRSGLDNRLYKGFTNNLEKRIYEHNQGKNKSTAPYRPWKLVYFEEFLSMAEARKRELYFKSGSGREFLKKILDA
jgi:putative endonuclease